VIALALQEPEISQALDDPYLPEVIWSHSRRSAFEQCLRRYFFEYYARWISDPAGRERVRQRKKVQNRFLRGGTVLHLIVRTYFRRAKEGQLMSKEWAISWARRLFSDDIRYSTSVRDGHVPHDDPLGPGLLSEILDRKEGGDALLAESLDAIVQSVGNFFESPDLERFRRVGQRPNSLIEKPIRLKAEGYRAMGQIDLAVNQKETAVITDWKMGGSAADGSDSLQLAFYGLWAVKEFDRPIADLRMFKVHLVTNQIVPFASDQRTLDNAAARIRQDLRRMEVVHKYGRAGEEAVFTPCAQPRICGQCVYLPVCTEGRKCLGR
jgi:PD-(D/E)XK nuclease superfamily